MFSTSRATHVDRDGDLTEKARAWRLWASREVQRRALVGHYILDGHLGYLSGRSTSILHPINNLGLSAGGHLFDAQGPDDWHQATSRESANNYSFREIYKQLFRMDASLPADEECLRAVKTFLDARVILECLRDLIRESQGPVSGFAGSIISVPAIDQTKAALMKIYDFMNEVWPLNHAERLELMLCWHILNVEARCNTIHLFDKICRHFQIPQSIFQSCVPDAGLETSIRWARESIEAKCAFLHATAALDIVGQLPGNHTQSFWMPIPIFAVSVMLNLFRLSGICFVSTPLTIYWWSTIDEGDRNVDLVDSRTSSAAMKTIAFLNSDISTPNSALGPSRNVLFDLKRLHASLHGSGVQWGLAMEMDTVLEKIAAMKAVNL